MTLRRVVTDAKGHKHAKAPSPAVELLQKPSESRPPSPEAIQAMLKAIVPSDRLVVRILVVDDSPTIRLSIAAAIKQARPVGSNVLEAKDRKSAVQQFKDHSPDVVFLDMLLGDNEKGLDVLRDILATKADARVVLMTGLPADDPEVRKAIMEGAFAHVQKPIRTESVRKVLNEVDEETGRFGRIR